MMHEDYTPNVKKTYIIRPPLCSTPANQDVLSGFPDVFLTPKPNTRERPPFPAFFRGPKVPAVSGRVNRVAQIFCM